MTETSTTTGEEQRLGTCRACQADILWARNIATGNGVPLDPDPVEWADGTRGLVAVATPDEITDSGTHIKGGEIGIRHLREHDDPAGQPSYRTHFATCPNADEFRKKSR